MGVAEVIPSNSNWFTIAALVLLVIVYFVRDYLPRSKRAAKEVKAEVTLAAEDREILRKVERDVEHIRHDQTELLILAKVAAERNRAK